jgi:uncharacterized sulfatase
MLGKMTEIFRRKIGVGLGVLLIAGIVLYSFRVDLIVALSGLQTKMRSSIGPTQEVVWQQGPDVAALHPSERQPNVIVILVDDMGFNDIATFGGGVAGGTVPTPNIDRLAAEGVTFLNGYAGNAVCAPSRAMLMTGRYSTRFGFEFTPTPGAMGKVASMINSESDAMRKSVIDGRALDGLPHYDDMGMAGSELTIAELLKAQGYHTAHIGKWHLGRAESFRPTSQGFDESLSMASGLYMPPNDPKVVNSKQDFDPIDRFLWANMQYAATFNDGEWFEPDQYLTDYYTDNAVKVIEANKNNPFFLYLAHWGIHTPLQAAKADYDALDHVDDHRLRVYGAMVTAIDRSVGKILDVLEENEIDDNTIVIFTSDNGGADYVGLPEINKPYRGWKLTLFEGGTHVPFFMRWPSQIDAGTVHEGPVSHIDIAPTAVAAAGGTMPEDRIIDGIDILPQIRLAEDAAERTIFWREGHYQAVLSGHWKMQVSDLPNKIWLYDLASDPTEQVNLASANPDRVAQLQALLDAHNASQVEPHWPSFVQMPISIDKTGADAQAENDEYIYWPN